MISCAFALLLPERLHIKTNDRQHYSAEVPSKLKMDLSKLNKIKNKQIKKPKHFTPSFMILAMLFELIDSSILNKLLRIIPISEL